MKFLLYLILFLHIVQPHAYALLSSTMVDDSRVIDWTTTGIDGDIPTDRSQSGSTILASTYNNGADDATSGIQAALNSAASDTYVKLGVGTFRINTNLTIPSNVSLIGSGMGVTYLYTYGTSNAAFYMGSNPGLSSGSATSISSGGIKDSTSFVVSSASGFDVGDLVYITGLNDTYVTPTGEGGGGCGWCGPVYTDESRLTSQITKITSIDGTTIGIETPLYYDYTSPTAIPFAPEVVRAGIESLTLYGNNTGLDRWFEMKGCDQCWLYEVEGDFSDDMIGYMSFDYRCEIRKSNFHGTFEAQTSGDDEALIIESSTSHCRIENSVFGRQHTSIIFRLSASGNTISYNYFYGCLDTVNNNLLLQHMSDHGAHPQFNLFEGNIIPKTNADSYWGSAAYETYFRNWGTQYTDIYEPFNSRGAPTTYHTPTKVNWAFAIEYLSSYCNLIGNVAGSDTAVTELSGTEYGYTEYPTSRNGFSGEYMWNYMIGYRLTSDSGATVPATTTTWNHGNYSHADAAIDQWEDGYSTTLPSSFIHSSKPAWFGSIAWPPIGSDIVEGISDSDNKAHKIPAQIFYETGDWPDTSAISAAITGTITSTTEADIVNGNKTIIITLTNDTWVADGATFNVQRQNIINGLDSAQSEGTGWNAEVGDREVVTAVVRTSSTICTITLTASASYSITSNETITVTIPNTATTEATEITAIPSFTVTDVGEEEQSGDFSSCKHEGNGAPAIYTIGGATISQ